MCQAPAPQKVWWPFRSAKDYGAPTEANRRHPARGRSPVLQPPNAETSGASRRLLSILERRPVGSGNHRDSPGPRQNSQLESADPPRVDLWSWKRLLDCESSVNLSQAHECGERNTGALALPNHGGCNAPKLKTPPYSAADRSKPSKRNSKELPEPETVGAQVVFRVRVLSVSRPVGSKRTTCIADCF